MGLLGRTIFREVASATLLGTVLFTFVLFLRSIGQLFELLVRSSAQPSAVAYLSALVLPPALVFTMPIGVLVGVLLALSRMSSDGEITALRAAGLPGRRVVRPVFMLAVVAVLLTSVCSLWLTPWSIRETYRIVNHLAAEQLTADIQPRVFQEQFPNAILYVDDVVPGPVVRWKKVFLADLGPAAENRGSGPGSGEGPVITVAREAIAIPDAAHNRIQLSLTDASRLQAGRDPSEYYTSTFPHGDQVLEAEPPGERRARPFRETDTRPLFQFARNSVDARIELHQRLALPPACLLLALVGIPLGVSSRKAGKSAAIVTAVFLAFIYYLGLISLIGLAKQGTLPVPVAVWAPNAIFATVGIFLLVRLEKSGDRDLVGGLRSRLSATFRWFRRLWKPLPPNGGLPPRAGRLPLLPQVLDTYVLSSYLLYFAVFLASFVLMTEVYTFFELLSDIIKNRIPMVRVISYLYYLAPMLIYDSAPISAMVAVLVTFGVMAKHNEVIAFKGCGVSLYRLSVPVLFTSLCLSGLLFAFDYYYVPEANRKQDAIRAEIKGSPVQTYLHPNRPWIRGHQSRIYHYRYFDPAAGVMGGVSLYEFDPVSFRLRRHVSAERAYWSASLKTWVFENGWRRDLAGAGGGGFETFQATTFSELDEAPSYFLKEVKQDKQMNFRELGDYIAELQQGGFDTVQLRIQYYKKFSVPLFALILAMIAVPFAFLTGSRGALAGVGVSFGIAVAYWSVNQLFEQVGNINQLPATAAAWSPNAVFFLAATYLMTRMKT
jgi:LPS export ABC transporter permease LptG/LPS export ABC transporter permease LptF